ncbi:hypothetical protein DENIS_0097 [Desulfonema ishimotonii]|uniref:Topoisomerase n=1 Tax=Desulfonema ishimotonii TaxID=45657 RepID=A0A401FQA5_9BACT|nr:DUF2726 domain-containing protein [Desulfonema ishimotonii]GBC59161.1 hypothetical protein DENIS_0097 [Desulfonema ishimotonii]
MNRIAIEAILVVIAAIAVVMILGRKRKPVIDDSYQAKRKKGNAADYPYLIEEDDGAAAFLSQEKKNNYPYRKKNALFTPAERSFLGVLTQTVGENARIFGKVRVADVVTPKKGVSRSDWQKAFNKISAKHFDFLLCDKNDLSVLCAVELDDRSHQSESRQTRDAFLNGACSAAGVPLVHVPARRTYTVSEIRELVAPHCCVSSALKRKPAPPAPGMDASEKICPKCASVMVRRVARKGPSAGKAFWACSAFPKCRHTEAAKE